MKNQWYLTVFAFLFLNVISSTAQCGLYTYQDMWLDDAGNAVADNYTQASCSRSSAYADVHVSMPSGYQVAASATGTTTAEAVAQSVTGAENGEGRFWGYNEVTATTVNACGATPILPLPSLADSSSWHARSSTISNPRPRQRTPVMTKPEYVSVITIPRLGAPRKQPRPTSIRTESQITKPRSL